MAQTFGLGERSEQETFSALTAQRQEKFWSRTNHTKNNLHAHPHQTTLRQQPLGPAGPRLLPRKLNAQSAGRSPNGFNPPQCTWWVDRRCAQNGWPLRFTQNHDRDAWRWPDFLANAVEIPAPQPGCIAVFDRWPGAGYGHVAFVESVADTRFTISHANYAIGSSIPIDIPVTVRRADMLFNPASPSAAQFSTGGRVFRMKFLKATYARYF